MDLSKAERQAEQRRLKEAHCLRILLQDILCFFILLSLGLLIVAAILCVVHNVNRIHQQQQQQVNGSRSENTVRRCFRRGFTWLRTHCHKQQPQQETKVEQLQEPEQGQPVEAKQISPHLAPTYQPINHPQHQRQQAGGDQVEAEPAASEPQTTIAGEQWPLGYQNLMQLLFR